MKVCGEPGCPNLSEKPLCDVHRAVRERARGTRQERGYDAEHEKNRARWAPAVAAGKVPCRRCGKIIEAGALWDLGHDETRSHTHPEHRACNRATAGRQA